VLPVDLISDRMQVKAMGLALVLLVVAVWGFWKALGEPPQDDQPGQKRRRKRRTK
jgi:hypothetical protein